MDNWVSPKYFHWIRRIHWKIFVITVKGLYPATICVRNMDATTVPARHLLETRFLNWTYLCFSDLSDSPNSLNSMKVLLHLGKTPILYNTIDKRCFLKVFSEKKLISRLIFLQSTVLEAINPENHVQLNQSSENQLVCQTGWIEKY